MTRFDRGRTYRKPNRWWNTLRPLLLVGLIGLAWIGWQRADVRSAIGLPMPAAVVVDQRFGPCDAPGYAVTCAVDGDTFRINQRRIRIANIDAPEVDGQCPAERTAARAATLALAAWLDDGPFFLLPAEEVPRDQYGRELHQPWREQPDGSRDDLADHLIHLGHAREFGGGAREGWC